MAKADSAPQSDIGDDEIRIPVYEDEIVVTKRRMLKEEVVVKRSDLQEGRAAEADQRR